MADDWKERLGDSLRERRKKSSEKRAANLAIYQGKFKCHKCGFISLKQAVIGREENGVVIFGDDWDHPADLLICRSCGLWFCEEHIHGPRCDDCVEKLVCHICGKKSRVPAVKVEKVGGKLVSSDDWSKPGDLDQCRECGKWVCEEHFHLGHCRVCAEKLVEKKGE